MKYLRNFGNVTDSTCPLEVFVVLVSSLLWFLFLYFGRCSFGLIAMLQVVFSALISSNFISTVPLLDVLDFMPVEILFLYC